MTTQPDPTSQAARATPVSAPESDPAQESLVRALQASFNILRVLMIVLVVLYLFSGVFRVEPGQQGLVARLGQLRLAPGEEGSQVFPPGWYLWMLPDPFDQKYVITGQVQTLKVTTFLFDHAEAATSKDLSKILRRARDLRPGVDGAMFTGDKNLSHGRWEIQYTIADAALFVKNIGESPADFEPLLQRLTETAVVREVARRTVEEVTRTALDSVRQGVQKRLQEELTELKTGVRVDQIVAYTIEPGAVRAAFIDVSRAENEKLALERQADERATEILNRAAGDQYTNLLQLIREYGDAQLRGVDQSELKELADEINARLVQVKSGQVAVKLGAARAQANKINKRLEAEYKEFTDHLKERAARPRIALLSLWVQMRDEVLSNRENEIFFVPASDEIEIHINRDMLRQRELEEERTRKRQMEGIR
ncbi:MAG: hypothetical protein KAY37_08040 [Phycisphaerae bacterium]|nr:hypothetical protein [Phycisphaerae bacterium]